MTGKHKKRLRGVLAVLGAVVLLSGLLLAIRVPEIGAAILLHPFVRKVTTTPPQGVEVVVIDGIGIQLKAWRASATGPRRGTVIYLHGFADNRGSSAGLFESFPAKGFDVIAYDSRAHGDSGGDACTFGVMEKQDLQKVIDTAGEGPVVLIGSSLGAAVAIQAAAVDPRVSAVVAAEVFSDLRTVATERAPSFLTGGTLEKALLTAEREGRFRISDASPELAARSIGIPVLLIHGSADSETPPKHSQRVYEALAGPKRLILVPGAGHNESLRGGVWKDIAAWIDGVLNTTPGLRSPTFNPEVPSSVPGAP
jgi:uncharacterized protein